jgi:hypothetical protein
MAGPQLEGWPPTWRPRRPSTSDGRRRPRPRGSSSAPVDRTHPCAPLSCMEGDSGSVTPVFHGCRSAVGPNCAPADAWSSSGARAVQRAVPTPASCAQARVRVSRLTPLHRTVQGARRAAPHRHLILRAPRSHPSRAVACERTPTRSATRFRTPKRGSGPRVPGPPRRRIRPVSVRRRVGSRG